MTVMLKTNLYVGLVNIFLIIHTPNGCISIYQLTDEMTEGEVEMAYPPLMLANRG